MPGIAALVSAISAATVTILSQASLPALVDGRILIGRQHDAEQSSAPRIVFIPIRSSWGDPRSMYSASNSGSSGQLVAQTQTRSILTERIEFEVHVWGQASPPDPDGGDFDATQAIYQALLLATHLCTSGSYDLTPLAWTDQAESGTALFKAGCEAVFGLIFDTPVLDQTLALVPSGTTASSTTQLQPADGTTPPETGCTGV